MTALRALFCLLLVALAAPAHAQGVSPNQLFGCNQSAQYDANTNGSTRLVVGTTPARIYVCGFQFFSDGTATVKLIYGTGGTCGSGTGSITPAYQFTGQTEIVDHLPVYTGLPPAPANNDVCINVNAGTQVQAIVYYTQF